jgi:parallel beta-helix repeat protein
MIADIATGHISIYFGFNGPNGTLTVITNKKTITSNSGTYLAPTLFRGEVQTAPNPVCPAISAIQGATTYNVGPGQSYLEPDTVPWADLKAGDVVNIFYRPEPYNHIVTVDVIGTEAAPVIINGVTDANGNRPIFDVSVNGVVAASTEVFYAGRDVSNGWQRLGVFNVLTRPGKTWVGDGSTFLPAWITFQNLEITGAYTKTPNSITLLDGSTASWNTGAGIYLKHSRDVTIRNCKLHGCSFGVFTFNSPALSPPKWTGDNVYAPVDAVLEIMFPKQ